MVNTNIDVNMNINMMEKTLTDSSSIIILRKSYSAQAGTSIADAILAISNNKRK